MELDQKYLLQFNRYLQLQRLVSISTVQPYSYSTVSCSHFCYYCIVFKRFILLMLEIISVQVIPQ